MKHAPNFSAGDSKKKILVIEDEDLLRWCIEFQLGSAGYDVRLAVDLKSADDVFQTFRPDLVICDQSLPDGKGLKLLKHWQEIHSAAGVILITAYTPPTLAEMRDGQVRVCLSKPFELNQLTSSVQLFFAPELPQS